GVEAMVANPASRPKAASAGGPEGRERQDAQAKGKAGSFAPGLLFVILSFFPALPALPAPPALIALFRRRPRHAFLRRAHALEHELLQAFSGVGLGRVDVALRIDGDTVHAAELARLAAAFAELRHDFERLAVDHVDVLVGAVSHIDPALLRV